MWSYNVNGLSHENQKAHEEMDFIATTMFTFGGYTEEVSDI
jgi:hypothetical protein